MPHKRCSTSAGAVNNNGRLGLLPVLDGALEDGVHAAEDFVGQLSSIDPVVDAPQLVVVHHGPGLLIVRFEALHEGLLRVV